MKIVSGAGILTATSAGKILLTRTLLCQKRSLHRLISHENEYLITGPSIHSLDLVEALVLPARFPTRTTRNPATRNASTSQLPYHPTKPAVTHILWHSGCNLHAALNYHTTRSQTPNDSSFPHAGISNAHNNFKTQLLRSSKHRKFHVLLAKSGFWFWFLRGAAGLSIPRQPCMHVPAIIVEKKTSPTISFTVYPK